MPPPSELDNVIREWDVKVCHDYIQQCVVDEWCEWERSVRGASNPPKTFDHLTKALASRPNYCLVGDSPTAADAAIVSHLLILHGDNEALQQNATLSCYCSIHKAAYDAAVQRSQPYDPLDPSLFRLVDSIFRDCIARVYGRDIPLPPNIVRLCASAKIPGDYQCSAAMPLAGRVQQPPRVVAQTLMDALTEAHPVLTEFQIQPPAFILCRVRASLLAQRLQLHGPPRLPLDPAQQHTVVVVDFSSPNIAKEMHVGHLRSTILGESVCRILEVEPTTQVHRVNHVGDWGTQFGMLIEYLQLQYPALRDEQSDAATAELPNITDLTQFYKQAKEQFDADPDFKRRSQLNVVQLQAGDPTCRRIWQLLCDISRTEFDRVYRRLDVTATEVGESFYNDKIPPVLQEFEAAGLLKVEEGGAKCLFHPNFGYPLMLQKSDGGYGYDSTDMAALKYRLQVLKADRIVVITDFSQAEHFAMIYQGGRTIGWVDRDQQLDHIGFGTVQGEDGKRFKTRSGDTVRLVDLLDEAVRRMEAELRQRLADGRTEIAADEVHAVAEAIGYGAVKYFDLKRNPTSNYKFSYDQMLDTKGDTAVYLLFARARLESILSKAEVDHNCHVSKLLEEGRRPTLDHPSERNLALALQLYADALEQARQEVCPSHICEYVYRVAVAASDFVTQCRVLGTPEMESRALLCYATIQAMQQAFDLLGIRKVTRI